MTNVSTEPTTYPVTTRAPSEPGAHVRSALRHTTRAGTRTRGRLAAAAAAYAAYIRIAGCTWQDGPPGPRQATETNARAKRS